MSDSLVDRSPVAAETSLEHLQSTITPNGRFFVRYHTDAPDLPTVPYRFRVGRARFSLADLLHLPRVSNVITLQCAGNARTAFNPIPAGVPWGFGAISTARWEGVRLRDVLHAADVDIAANAYVIVRGLDRPESADVPAYRRSLPMARALADHTLLVDTMNGEPLPRAHGGPLRLIVAGWTANHSVKWIDSIASSQTPDDGYWMTQAYCERNAEGAIVPIERPPSIAIITSHGTGTAPRTAHVQGIAFGDPAPTRVRIDVDGRTVGSASVDYKLGPFAWGRWTFAAPLPLGPHAITVRPVAADGRIGPLVATWNAQGYCYDGPHTIEVTLLDAF